MTNYFKAIFADGSVAARSTARVYTHAIKAGHCFAGSEALAVKAARGGEIASAAEISAAEYRAIMKGNRS